MNAGYPALVPVTRAKPRLHDLRRITAIAQTFLEYLRTERGCSPNTLQSYRLDLRILIQLMSDQGLTDWSQVTHRHIRGLIFDLTNAGKARATIRRHLAAYRSFWKFLRREELTAMSPLDLLAFRRSGDGSRATLMKRRSSTFWGQSREIVLWRYATVRCWS